MSRVAARLGLRRRFAQFEREVTGERIRDKIAASKQKGMWMGGYPPLGYDVADRKLVVNDAEAETVRHIFERYTVLQSVRALKEELDAAPSLLTGLVYDGAGARMSPTHANKRGTRNRYYVRQTLLKQLRATAPAGSCRVPAADLEAIVETAICDLLRDPAAIDDVARAVFPEIASRKALLTAAGDLSRTLPTLPAAEKMVMFKTLIGRITVRPEVVEIELRGSGLATIVQPEINVAGADLPVIRRTIPARLKRTGMQTKLLIDSNSGKSREPDRSLLRLLARAHQFQQAMMTSQGNTMRDLAQEAGVGPTYFARVVRLAFLCPAITDAILQGRQPDALTANKLQHVKHLPNAWSDHQRQLQLT